MICTDCRTKSHETCIVRNASKRPADCDCQHRVEQKTIVLPPEKIPARVVVIPIVE